MMVHICVKGEVCPKRGKQVFFADFPFLKPRLGEGCLDLVRMNLIQRDWPSMVYKRGWAVGEGGEGKDFEIWFGLASDWV